MGYTYLQKMAMMSVWEVGHRWAGFDPDETDPENPPKAVKEMLRELLEAVSTLLNLFDKSGREQLDKYVPIIGHIIPNKALLRAAELLHARQFPKKELDDLYILKTEVEKWCRITGSPVPSFWFAPDEVSFHEQHLGKGWEPHNLATDDTPKPPAKQRQDQQDKALVQAAALRIWNDDKSIRIAAMIKRKEIAIDANGKQYVSKTLHRWLKEVAPASAHKPGRPSKKPK